MGALLPDEFIFATTLDGKYVIDVMFWADNMASAHCC